MREEGPVRTGPKRRKGSLYYDKLQGHSSGMSLQLGQINGNCPEWQFPLVGRYGGLFFFLEMAVGAFGRTFLVTDPLFMALFTPGMEGKFYGVELFVCKILIMATLAL